MTTQQYQLFEPIQHILERPDMYVGSKQKEEIEDYVYKVFFNKEGEYEGNLVKTKITVSPAFSRTFLEILSNAIDNLERKSAKPMSYVEVVLTKNQISVTNDGAVIPITINEHGIYNHSLIFGHLLSGSNYDDTKDRFTAGRNGLGAKLTNVLASEFTVEGVDPQHKLKLIQTWTHNMKQTDGPVITKSNLTNGYTKITWKPDLKWFGMSTIDNKIIEYLSASCVYSAMTAGVMLSKPLKVKLTIPTNDGNLAQISLPNKFDTFFDLMSMCPVKELLKLQDEHSKVLLSPSVDDNGFEVFSFVNGIRTKNGGKHVNTWTDAILKPLVEKLNGSNKNDSSKLTIKDVKPFFRLLVVTRVVNPAFDSQEKNELKTPVHTTPISPDKIKKILSWSIKDAIKGLANKKEKKVVAKNLTALPKLIIDGYEKANNAGKGKSQECSLIVCEGLSAKTFCVEGITHGIPGLPGKGRDYYGVYPLRGKLLNTQNATPSAIAKNTVIVNLMKILGLEYDKPFNINKLNYGRVIILTDADTDGIHIEGLLLNFFHSLFPESLRGSSSSAFIISMKTPLVKIGADQYFYDDRAWKNFCKQQDVSKLKNIQYHKGLGTIKQSDVAKVFGKKMVVFVEDSKTDNAFKVAFGKDFSDDRKDLLARFSTLQDSDRYLSLDSTTQPQIVYSLTNFLSTELPKFHHDDCKRSIPGGIDGLKESQRKIVYTAKLRKLKEKIKVAQFAAAVAENTSYHHGEQNLANTIINLSQSFVGSNNLPLFSEEGMFGTRLEGGKDAASPRYIFTNKRDYFDALFPEEDDPLLLRREDDGVLIEPYYYVPTIPLLLVNGSMGIGTGWSSFCPCFNPDDIIDVSALWMNNNKKEFDKTVKTLVPWYRGFIGKIHKTENSETKFTTSGIIKKTNSGIIISELPIGEWTSNFVRWLLDQNIDFNDRSTPQNVVIEIKNNTDLNDFKKKLTTSLSLDNVVVFDQKEDITEATITDIFNMWGKEKLRILDLRKNTKLQKLEKDLEIFTIKREFILQVKAKKIDLTADLPTIVAKIKKITLNESYHMILLEMNVRSLTLEKSDELFKKIQTTAEEIETLSKKTTREIWFEDVNRLLSFW
jgi:DNA topoisomerase-2